MIKDDTMKNPVLISELKKRVIFSINGFSGSYFNDLLSHHRGHSGGDETLVQIST
jgi:uncharacterized protein YjlB